MGKVVMVAGGFDPINGQGHISHILGAMELGDWIVVALARDDQLVLKKGYTFYPSYKDRKCVLEAILKAEGEVIMQVDKGKTSCAETIRLIKPAIFAKGGDREPKVNPIPESEIKACKEVGCLIVYGVGDDKIQSSSALVEVAKGTIMEKFEGTRMLILDSDGVLVPSGMGIQETVTGQYRKVVMETSIIIDRLAQKINKLKKKMRICISSGRSLLYLQSVYSRILGNGVILQAENGNLSLVDGRIIQHIVYDDGYFDKLLRIRDDIAKLDIKGFEPKQFMMTVHAEREIPEVYSIVKRYDANHELKVMWSGEAFDIQAKGVSKAEGTQAITSYLGIALKDVVAIGDNTNDRELVAAVGIGVSTCKETLEASYYMSAEELIDCLLEV